MAAFGFLPQYFVRWWGPTNCPICLKMNATSVVWTIVDGGDTQNLLAVKFFFEFCALSDSGDAKTL